MVLFTVTALLKADILHFTTTRYYFFLGLFLFLKALRSPSVAHYSKLEATLGKDGAQWSFIRWMLQRLVNKKCSNTCSRLLRSIEPKQKSGNLLQAQVSLH